MKHGTAPTRQHARLLLALCLTACFACGCGEAVGPERFYAENREALENAVYKIMANGNVDGVQIQGVERISYWESENPTIEFIISTSGSVPACTYKGIYYSASGEPAAFQCADVALTETETGWAWAAEGDNRGTTVHIEGNWFAFEAAL